MPLLAPQGHRLQHRSPEVARARHTDAHLLDARRRLVLPAEVGAVTLRVLHRTLVDLSGPRKLGEQVTGRFVIDAGPALAEAGKERDSWPYLFVGDDIREPTRVAGEE